MTAQDFEIMAPVGSYESLTAAIQGGANSIYFGVEGLNMRARSSNNFTLDDLREIARICREHGMKSYLTVNTVIYDSDIALMRRKGSWANILPQITLFGGVSSSYYKELHRDGYDSFGRQFRNNLGQYFGVSMSVPLFGRFSGVVGMRRARNDWRIAQEQYEEQKAELRKLVIQAVNDREGCLRETVQMQKKVASDSLAYRVTRRKYEEGLMTSLDVQNSAATLFESETLLLQSKLTYLLKCRLVDYYKGKTIINEQLTINN